MNMNIPIENLLILSPQNLIQLDERNIYNLILYYCKENNPQELRYKTLTLLIESYLLFLKIRKPEQTDYFISNYHNVKFDLNKIMNTLIEIEDYERCITIRDMLNQLELFKTYLLLTRESTKINIEEILKNFNIK